MSAVNEVLTSGWLTTGPNVCEFESAFAEYVGAKHAIAVSNGTAALHISLLSAGIGCGDRVITSPNTFLASANAAAFVGAIPDFVDIDPVSHNLCPEHLEVNWTEDTRAVVAVDYAGQSCELKRIYELAHARNTVVIEDASHAVGGGFHESGQHWKTGGHPWADMTTFSFHPVKTMTTGEGGMITTENDELASKARLIRNHGMVRDAALFIGLASSEQSNGNHLHERGPWYYEMHELGFNYRITDFQCALGLSQLQKLDSFVVRRRQIVDHYNEAFSQIEAISTPELKLTKNHDATSWHLYTVQIDFLKLGKSRSEIMAKLRDFGIGTQVLYIPVYLQPWYRKSYGYQSGKCPHAESFYAKALSLPLFPAMSQADVDLVVQIVREVLCSE
jgi:perosamine synthetase